MTLTKAELKVLLALGEPTTLTRLARNLGLSKGTLSALLHSLEKKGLIKLEGKKPLLVKPTENKALELLRTIKTQYPYLDERILTGNWLKVLSALEVEKPQSLWLIQLKVNVSRATLHRILNELMERLIVGKTSEGYFLSERFALLKAFADEYFYLQNSLKAKELDRKAVLVWSGVGELILATKTFKGKNLGDFQLTGLARFSGYGLPLISPGVYHYYWPSKGLSLEEILVHALKISRDARELLYAITLLKAHRFDEKKLRRLALKFGVSEIVEGIIEYLNGKDEPYPFPSQEEVEELCRQYFGGCGDDNAEEAD